MLEFWSNLTYTTKFSTIAFFATAALGFLSMGMLGALLYYPVSILLTNYPGIDDVHGDWVWPAVIMIGIGWSFGFVLAGLAWHFLHPHIDSLIVLRIIYGLILWLWAGFLWWRVLRGKFPARMKQTS